VIWPVGNCGDGVAPADGVAEVTGDGAGTFGTAKGVDCGDGAA
jgi:hypothetical protein